MLQTFILFFSIAYCFTAYSDVELPNLKAVTNDTINAFSSHIDQNKVGFSEHSMRQVSLFDDK